MTRKYDDDIRQVEARLRLERQALVAQVAALGTSVRKAVVSPTGLVMAAVAGFLIGEMTRPRRPPPPAQPQLNAARNLGLGGLLGSAALALVRARYGSPWMLGRSALQHLMEPRNRAAASTAGSYSSAVRQPVRETDTVT